MKKYVFTVLMVIWMAIIFVMSARDGNESGDMSHNVGRLIGRIFMPGFEQMKEDDQEAYAENIDFYVRKTAHAMEYTILGVLASLCFYYYEIRHYAVMGFLLGVLYAASDEIHQVFVPGRSGQLTDVMLDSCGVLAGSLTCFLVIKRIRTYRSHILESSEQ